MSMSQRSLIVQPAPRMTNAPIENFVIIHRSGNDPMGATIPMLHMHGHNSSHVPIGLSSRASKAYGWIEEGKLFTIDCGVLILWVVLIAFVPPGGDVPPLARTMGVIFCKVLILWEETHRALLVIHREKTSCPP
eukprot:3048241-Rhodomonas_salina.1